MRKHGMCSGWDEYRYGTKQPIRLAGRKAAPLLAGEKRQHLIEKTMNALRDWRLTPFEYEGAARASLRAGLCLLTSDWQLSDEEAALIVKDALRRLGAVRPTWDQGQPDYTDSRDCCSWCRGPLDEYSISKRRRYCSRECARFALQRRDFEVRDRENSAYDAAWTVLQAAFERTCTHCSLKFWTNKRDASFCTRACRDASIRQRPETIPCEECLKDFAPIDKQSRFCCHQCYSRSMEKAVVHRECLWCRGQFVAASVLARYCEPCNADVTRAHDALARVKLGKAVKLTTPVFDYVFQAPTYRPGFTARRFDRMFCEAA